jgi:hypothetical protein
MNDHQDENRRPVPTGVIVSGVLIPVLTFGTFGLYLYEPRYAEVGFGALCLAGAWVFAADAFDLLWWRPRTFTRGDRLAFAGGYAALGVGLVGWGLAVGIAVTASYAGLLLLGAAWRAGVLREWDLVDFTLRFAAVCGVVAAVAWWWAVTGGPDASG